MIGKLFGKRDKSIPTLLVELKDITIDYAKQETVTPLKGLGRYIAFGLVGSIAMGIGLLMWSLAMLRALQNETGSTFTGHLSWAPYLLTLVACALVIGLCAVAIMSDKRRSNKRREERMEQHATEERERARNAQNAHVGANS